jgi:hypothetical protein
MENLPQLTQRIDLEVIGEVRRARLAVTNGMGPDLARCVHDTPLTIVDHQTAEEEPVQSLRFFRL